MQLLLQRFDDPYPLHSINSNMKRSLRQQRPKKPSRAVLASIFLFLVLESTTITHGFAPTSYTSRRPFSTIMYSKNSKENSSTNSRTPKTLGYTPLLDHEILTSTEERRLGSAIQKARALQEELAKLIEMKQKEHAEKSGWIEDDDEEDEEEDDIYSHLTVYAKEDYEQQDELLDYSLDVERKNQESLLPAAWMEENDFIDWKRQIEILTEDDLQMLGGFQDTEQIQQILEDGVAARDTLIRSNIRLVVSIAKKWSKQTAKSKGISVVAAYAGGWDRPSLDEAVQEGIFGLSKAADRFDPDRKLRFATYATYWVTNYVRQCFRTASTGCLRVPSGFHEARTKYRKLSKDYFEVFGELPTVEWVADQMGLAPKRLRLILDRTRPLLSTDGPFATGAITRAGKAGNDEGDHLLISDTLIDDEVEPTEYVELSFLRQSLENAMASELAPHERDIVRLRLGLDDGVSRTAREVAEHCGGTLSISDVRTTEKRAFKKLRSPRSLASYKLLAYLDFAGADEATLTLR